MSFTPEAIQELRRAEDLTKLQDAVNEAELDAIVMPPGFAITDLEQYRDQRRRLTGIMKTASIDSFHRYITQFMQAGAETLVFIEPQEMAANCALNFGTTIKPGHADHWAKLVLEQTAEYRAMLKAAKAGRTAQRETAEWCEDYVHCCVFLAADETEIPPAKAIKAIRNLKIEAKATATTGVGNYSREKSLLESTAVDTSEGLPHFIRYTCVPYNDLQQRSFMLRLGSGHDAGGNQVFMLQIIRHDIDVQQMAEELASLLQQKMQGTQVFLGNFSKKV